MVVLIGLRMHDDGVADAGLKNEIVVRPQRFGGRTVTGVGVIREAFRIEQVDVRLACGRGGRRGSRRSQGRQ